MEVSSCGLDMRQFAEGDIPQECRALVLPDVNSIVGTWEEIKTICQSPEPILSKCGVGFIKRKATAAATLKTEIQLKSVDAKGNPVFFLKTYYPLGITKETTFPTDGTVVDQPDPDTCDWKCLAVWCNGRMIQKRSGKHGTMFDARAILRRHPTGATDDATMMCFRWTLVDAAGEKTVIQNYLKKIK